MTRRILIAEDEPVTRHLLQSTLHDSGAEVTTCTDGLEAVRRLELSDPPGMDGIDVCRRLRRQESPVYFILLTSKNHPEDVARELEAGADDYILKPFHRAELLARVRVGLRVSAIQRELRQHVDHLERALANVKQLQGLLPICAYCKRIRNDQNYWDQLETYISKHSEAQFSHGICPSCFERALKNE